MHFDVGQMSLRQERGRNMFNIQASSLLQSHAVIMKASGLIHVPTNTISKAEDREALGDRQESVRIRHFLWVEW